MFLFLNLRKTATVLAALLVFSLITTPLISAIPRLGNDVRPVFQEINLKLNPDLADYSGSVAVKLEVMKPVQSFRFHSDQIEYSSIALSGENGLIDITYEVVEPDQIKIKANTILEQGIYNLKAEFTNEFNTQAVSLYRAEKDGESYLFTQMEDMEARKAFPCWDEPGYKNPFQLTLTVSDDNYPISNTPIESETKKDNWTTYKFMKTKPLSTYLLAICLGPFDLIDVPDMSIPTRIVTAKGKGNMTNMAVKTAPPLLKWFEKYFNRPYPYKKLDLIAVPEFWPGGMENAGAITFTEGSLVVDENSATLPDKRWQASVISHELAHMWFGDLVTMQWWDDLWLNEAFAEWIGNRAVSEVYPQYDIMLSGIPSLHRQMNRDARPSAEAIRQPIEENSDLLGNIGAVYYKGEHVINMFERGIGTETFRKGVLDYIDANAWGNAKAEDLWQALNKITETDFAEAIKTFINQPGIPLVTLEPEGDGSYKLSQTRFVNYGNEPLEFDYWHIPISLKYKTENGVKTFSTMLTGESKTIKLPSDGKINWVMPNMEFTGYYRWRVPVNMLLEITENASTDLSVIERIGLLRNLSALLDAGVIGGDDYMDVVSRFNKDSHPNVLFSVLNGMSKIRGSFITDDLKEPFAKFVNKTLKPTMEMIGLEAKEGEKESFAQVRENIINWLAEYGNDKELLDYTKQKFKMFLNDANSVDPSLIYTFASLACQDGNQELFDLCKERFENASTPQMRDLFLITLGSFRDTDLQKQALNYNMSDKVRPQEIQTILDLISESSEEKADMVLDWIFDNYDLIKSKMPPIYVPYLTYFASGCSISRLENAKQFFSKPEITSDGIASQFEKVSDFVNDCNSLRNREIEKVTAYLNSI
jgi:alanyl aminopeptidase